MQNATQNQAKKRKPEEGVFSWVKKKLFRVMGFSAGLPTDQEPLTPMRVTTSEEKKEAGMTLLHLAVATGDKEGVKRLLENNPKAQLESRNQSNETPLKLALYPQKGQPQIEIAIMLLQKGASLIELNKEIDEIYWQGKLWSDALSWGDIDLLKIMISQGLDINIGVEPTFCSLLHCVVDGSITCPLPHKPNLVSILLELGIDVNSKDREERTALFHVTNAQDAQILLQYGVEVNARDNRGQTALFAAVEKQRWDVVKCLLNNGADPYHPDYNYRTVIHLARQGGPHNEFSKKIKRKISLDEPFKESISSTIKELLEKALKEATIQNKKILIILGETHNHYRDYLIEKMLLKIAHEVGIQTAYIELPKKYTNLYDAGVYLSLDYVKKINLQIIYCDNLRLESNQLGEVVKHRCSEQGIEQRNRGISQEIETTNQQGVLITGLWHLKGLIDDKLTGINRQVYYIVPLCLSPQSAFLLRNEKPEEVLFAFNADKVIQLTPEGIDPAQAEKVLNQHNYLEERLPNVKIVRKNINGIFKLK